MYRGNYGPPAMGPDGYEGAMNGSAVKKKKKGKTSSSPADLLERIQKRLRSENFFDINESDAMSSPSSSNSRMKFNSNQQHNSFSDPEQANPPGDMILPQPLPSAQHPANFSPHLHSSQDYSYSGQQNSDYRHQQPASLPKHSSEAQSSNSKRNVSSRLGPPALAAEMHSGKERVPFIPGLGSDMEMTSAESFPTVASFNKPSITDFLDESFNSQDIGPPAQTDYWKHGVSENSSTSMQSKSSSHAHSRSPSVSDLQQSSLNTEFKSGRSGTFSFLNSASRIQKNAAVASTIGKDRSSVYSGSNSSRRSYQKNTFNSRASSRGLHTRNSPARSKHPSTFVSKSGRTGSLVLPVHCDKEKTSGNFNHQGAMPSRKFSSKWERRFSGYDTGSENDSGLSKNWKNCSEERVPGSTIPVPDFNSSNDHVSEMDLPHVALHCHVCRLQNFSNRQAYAKHLQTPHHQHMFQLLEVRNESLETFKRAAAKLSSRALESEVMADGSVKEVQGASGSNFIRCSYCFATVLNTAVDAHNQLLQHKELVEFTRPLCCGIKFVNRRSYESHKSTTKHLARKYSKEKEFISQVILHVDEETLKSKTEQPNAKKEKMNHISMNIPQSTYIQKVLEKLESDPCVQDGKSNYCLVCEVSVPEYRRTFHPSCSDHHENKHTYSTVNKSRIMRLVGNLVTVIGQPIKSDTTEVSDLKHGTASLPSKLSSHSEEKVFSVASEIEGCDDFEYDLDGVTSIADEDRKSQVKKEHTGMSTKDEEKVHKLHPTKKELASLENNDVAATSDIKAITEAIDMEVASSNDSGEEGQFEYEFSAAKPVDAEQGKAKDLKPTLAKKGITTPGLMKQKVPEHGDNIGEEDDEFDYEFSKTVPGQSNILPPLDATITDRSNVKSSKITKSTPKSKETGTIEKENHSISQKMIRQIEKNRLNLPELDNVLKEATIPLEKSAEFNTDKLQAQDEKDIDDEIDDFDYQFETPCVAENMPTVQATSSASSIDCMTSTVTVASTVNTKTSTIHQTGSWKMATVAEPVVTTAKTPIRSVDSKKDMDYVTEAHDKNDEEEEFEYQFRGFVSEEGQLNDRVDKTKEVEEKVVDVQNKGVKEAKNTSDEDEFEYQIEEEKCIEKESQSIVLKDVGGEDEFEYQVEENDAEEVIEYHLDEEEEEFEYDMEEDVADEDGFQYQMEDKKAAQDEKSEQVSPTVANKSESNEVQDEEAGEEEFEYKMETQDCKESKGETAKHAEDVHAKIKEAEDNLTENADFEYKMQEPKDNLDSVKDNDEGDEFKYQLGETNVKGATFDCKFNDKTSKEKDTDIVEEDHAEVEDHAEEEDEFDYEIPDKLAGLEKSDAPDTGGLGGSNNHHHELGEEDECAFDYELPDDEVSDTAKSTASDKFTKETTEDVKLNPPKVVSSKESSQVASLEGDNTEKCEDEFDYDLEEYETVVDSVSGALGKTSDAVKVQLTEDSSSSDENISIRSTEKRESVKTSSPLKFQIPSVAPYLSVAPHDDAVDSNLCENVKSAECPAASEVLEVSAPLPPRSPASPKRSVRTSPVRISTRILSQSPAKTSSRPPARESVSSPERSSARSPAKMSVTPPARLLSASSNRATATSPFNDGVSSAHTSVSSPGTAAPFANSYTDVELNVMKDVTSEPSESVVPINKTTGDNSEDQADTGCTLPKDSEIDESLKSRDDLVSAVKEEADDLTSLEAVDTKLFEFLESKSIKAESAERTDKVDIIDSDSMKKIVEVKEDEEELSRNRTNKSRSRRSRLTPLKEARVTPADDDTESPVVTSRRLGVKRGRASIPNNASEEESHETDELVRTPSKRPARGRALKQEMNEEITETVDVLLEVIAEEDPSPQKKGRASKRKVKGQTALPDDVSSEMLPASAHEKEEEDIEEVEVKMTSPRGRRGGRARRGSVIKSSAKTLNVSIDEENTLTDTEKTSGGRKREAPSNSDDEGSVCSVTRVGRPTKRGRGGLAAKGVATPKTPAASSRKTIATVRTPATCRKSSPGAAAAAASTDTLQTGRGGKGQASNTTAVESRSKRRSCAPIRYE